GGPARCSLRLSSLGLRQRVGSRRCRTHTMSDQTTHVQPNTTERTYSVPADVPLLPLRDTVLFPNSFMPLAVARESSVKLIDEAISGGKLVGVFTQKDPTLEEPGQADLHAIGTLTHIHK